MTKRGDVRVPRTEVVAFALLAMVPILPYLTLLLSDGVPRFDLVADLAQMEYVTRRVWNGDTLLGLASRFRWSHPGPFFFYVLAPFQKMFGDSSTGMYVGTCAVSAVAAGATVGATRALAHRAHAIAVLVVVLAWFAAFGNVAGNPWVRVVVGLPLIAYMVFATLFARGASVAAIPAVFFGAIAAETHVSTVPTTVVVGGVALAAFFVVRRAVPLARRDRLHLATASALLLVALVPPVIEELQIGEGNLSKLLHFFRHRDEPYKPLGVAIDDWMIATSWLPERVLGLSLPDDTEVPFVMRWDPVPIGASKTALLIAWAHVAAIVSAAALAFRRRDGASLALLIFAAIGDVLAVVAIRAIVGEEHYSLLFWTTAASSVGWMGVLSTFGRAGYEASCRAIRLRIRPGAFALLAPLAALALGSSALQRAWLERYPHAPATDPLHGADRRKVYEMLRADLENGGALPVLHVDGAFGVTMSMVLEADKDGVDFRVADRDLWGFPGTRPALPEEQERVRHIWFSEPGFEPAVAPCLEVAATIGQISILSSSSDVADCAD